jgi:hypothetical protein
LGLLATHKAIADFVGMITIREPLWRIEPHRHERIAREVTRQASRKQLGRHFDRISIVQGDEGPELEAVFLDCANAYAASNDLAALVLDVAAEAHAQRVTR